MNIREAYSDERILSAARTIMDERFMRGAALSTPSSVREYLTARLATHTNEVFSAVFLDARHRVIAFEELFHGSITSASVYPRHVVRRAMDWNASALIIAHNHPSGVAEPSRADENITRRLKDALGLIDVQLLDHFVIGGNDAVSFAERGLL